jgi:CRISPR-associated protein Csd2
MIQEEPELYPEDDEGTDNGTAHEDVALRPGLNADAPADVARYISAEVRQFYDVFSYRHAAAILANSFPNELEQLEKALLAFRITTQEISLPGGNESEMPKKFSRVLRPYGWVETRIQGDLLVRLAEYEEEIKPDGKIRKTKRLAGEPRLIENYIDGHKIDYVKGRVAFDLEWNSKDQTFDRDLYALRTFHECGLISAGVLVTRSASLNPVFDVLPLLKKDGSIDAKKDGSPKLCKQKYGASTTWMGKLLYRLNAGRHGGCPVLVFGITPKLITDWNNHAFPPADRSE